MKNPKWVDTNSAASIADCLNHPEDYRDDNGFTLLATGVDLGAMFQTPLQDEKSEGGQQ